jgi:hypothetical protein
MSRLLPHKDPDYLDALHRVRHQKGRSPEDLIKTLAVLQSCRVSGTCTEADRHEAEIARVFSLLAGER